LAASYFTSRYFIPRCKKYLDSKGIAVRIKKMLKNLEELIAIIRQRKESLPEKSYTSKLLKNKKLNIEKIKEEVRNSSRL
jgi:Phosphoribosyl-ATP pyrophosphohydrolase